MDPRILFPDERHAAYCVFCGAPPSTREHAASRVLLDDPLPDNLPIVGSCNSCNSGFSQDEEYLACLIDCVIAGSTDPAKVNRPKVRAALLHSPSLASKLSACHTGDSSGVERWTPDEVRVRNVILKLARGHVAHQYGEPLLEKPTSIIVTPLALMSDSQRETFDTIPESSVCPEIGSRAFVNLIMYGNEVHGLDNGWHILQPGRYRYAVAHRDKIVAKIVLSEYLAAEVAW